jgi:ATP-citrate lyase alpha-subunit
MMTLYSFLITTILARSGPHYTEHGPNGTRQLNYALAVEQVTTQKKNNLILNVDGCIGVLLVDLLKELKFTDREIDEMVKAGLFNAFFVLGRSIGLIGHYFDQIRLEQDLYRHPLDDILYDVPKGREKLG